MGNVAEGLAYKQMTPERCMRYIDEILTELNRNFPPGFKYEGMVKCSAMMQFQEMLKLPKRRKHYELSKTDCFVVHCKFSLYGVDLRPRALLLPIVDRHGITSIWGTTFVLSPVAVDNIFSSENGSIFIQFIGSRDNFHALDVSFMVNGLTRRSSTVYAELHKKADASDRKSTLFNYIAATYGVTETFKLFFDAEVVVGDELNEADYPPEEWAMCSSHGKGTRYRGPTTAIKLAVRKEDMSKPGVESAIGAFFFCLDTVVPKGFVEVEYINEPIMWRRILSHFIFKDEDIVKNMKKIEEHLASLPGYVNSITRRKLHLEGVMVNDMDGLMAHLMSNFNIICNAREASDVTDKRLTVMRYVLFDIENRLVRLSFEAKKITDAAISREKIETLLDKKWPADAISNIREKHGEVSVLATPNDNFMLKVTLPVVGQENANGKRGSGSINLQNPLYRLHASSAGLYSYELINKSKPTGTTRLNPFINVDDDGKVTISQDLKMRIEETQKVITRKVGTDEKAE